MYGMRFSDLVSPGSRDELNRMTSHIQNGVLTNYAYRADGMRVTKTAPSAATSFAYDGQMGIEDVDTSTGKPTAVTDYAIGARGIDRMVKTQNGSSVTAYPIYDGHGNMVSTLEEATGGSYTTA